MSFFFFQAEDGIRDLVRSRGLGDVYKRQGQIGEGRAVEDLGEALVDALGIGDRRHPAQGQRLSLIHI